MSGPVEMTLENAWQHYSRDVLQHNAFTSPLEVQKARMLFYSGALAVLTFQEAVSQPHVPAAVGERVLIGMREEIEAFAAEQSGEDPPKPDKPNLVLVKP